MQCNISVTSVIYFILSLVILSFNLNPSKRVFILHSVLRNLIVDFFSAHLDLDISKYRYDGLGENFFLNVKGTLH